jgi:hypothetical protein
METLTERTRMSEQTDTPRTDEISWIQSSEEIVEADFARQLERELAAVTEQRDELLRYNEAFRNETLRRLRFNQKSYSAELARSNHYKQQRDRLAEVLDLIVSEADRPISLRSCSPAYRAKQALQSLNTNAKSAAAGSERKDHE